MISEEFYESLAQQLKQPHGDFALQIADKMNESNEFLYDFVLNEMNVADYDSILEIGFGNGKFFDKFLLKDNHVKAAGTDFSQEMVAAATAYNASFITDRRLSLQHNNSDCLSFHSHSFDKAFCINVVYFWEMPADHLLEVKRVLKPGGKFYTAIRTKECMQQLPFTRYGFKLYNLHEWSHILTSQGFTIEKISSVKEPAAEISDQIYPIESLVFTATV